MEINGTSAVSIAVDVVIKQFVDEVHVRQEHAPAAVAGESDFVQKLADVLALAHVADGLAELLPLVCNHLSAAEASDWDDHISPIITNNNRPSNLTPNT